MATIEIVNRATDEVIDEIFGVDEGSWEVYWALQGNDEDFTWRAVED
jgi:hypothetical protein